MEQAISELKREFRSNCPVSCGLDLLGDKWSLLVMRDILVAEKHTYKEFLASSEGIATNILANRLKKLEAWGLIHKSKSPENGRVNLYHATERGRDVLPVLTAVGRWALRHLPGEHPTMLQVELPHQNDR